MRCRVLCRVFGGFCRAVHCRRVLRQPVEFPFQRFEADVVLLAFEHDVGERRQDGSEVLERG